MNAEPALELIDIVKTYPGEPPVHALAGVNLRVDTGEMVELAEDVVEDDLPPNA